MLCGKFLFPQKCDARQMTWYAIVTLQKTHQLPLEHNNLI